MAITIGSNYIRSNTDLQMRVNNGTTVAVYQTNGIRYSNSRVPAFTASGQGGWYYSGQMGGDNAEWIDSNISGWTWQVSQQNAGSYGFSGGQQLLRLCWVGPHGKGLRPTTDQVGKNKLVSS